MPTIQGELQKALFKVTGEVIRLYGAGRTDAGVHAKAQVAAFESGAQITSNNYVRALNYYLPADIAIKEAFEAEDILYLGASPGIY